ncbi:MAG: beta-phosphoglucomutase [Oscillospiraceae bacterium]
MRYKGIIFDLDGVITSSDRYHYLAWKKIADALGIAFDETVNNRLRGVSRMKSLDIILEAYPGTLTEREKQAYAEKKNTFYRELLREHMSEKDLSREVKDTIDAIREKGLRMAIGSSSKNAKLILSRLGLDDYFDAVSDGTNITHSKPDPEVFLKASAYLHLEPEVCLVVEDAEAGIRAAQAGHMDSAAIGDAVRYAIATYNLDTFSDLLKIV